MKKNFGLLGYNIKNSLSPYIHKSLFSILKVDANYNLFDLPPEKLKNFLENINNLDGFNVTMPYKNIMFNKIEKKDKTAKFFKTTNTIIKENSNFISYNTDYYGFIKTIEHFEIELNKNCLLLGLGGAGKIVAFSVMERGSFLTVAVRASSIERSKNVLFSFLPKKYNKKFEVVDIKKIPQKNYKTIINATPIGMNHLKNESPINFKTLFGCQNAIDLIYYPTKTKFLKMAKKLKIKTVNGLFMLIMQAKKTDELIFKTNFKNNSISKIYFSLLKNLI